MTLTTCELPDRARASRGSQPTGRLWAPARSAGQRRVRRYMKADEILCCPS